jgi:hypothetical protein
VTAQERRVLLRIAEGKRTKEIAAVLAISVKTAESHRGADHGEARHSRDGRAGPLRHPARRDRALISDSRFPSEISWLAIGYFSPLQYGSP